MPNSKISKANGASCFILFIGLSFRVKKSPRFTVGKWSDLRLVVGIPKHTWWNTLWNSVRDFRFTTDTNIAWIQLRIANPVKYISWCYALWLNHCTNFKSYEVLYMLPVRLSPFRRVLLVSVLTQTWDKRDCLGLIPVLPFQLSTPCECAA